MADSTSSRVSFTLDSSLDSVNKIELTAEQIAQRAGFDEDTIPHIAMAVREAAVNAVLHGNRQDEVKLVEVAFKSSPGAIEITVRDQGAGFDPKSVPDPTDPQNILKTSGRGILFMRTFMDEVEWSRHPEGGTMVRMIKKI